MLPRFRSLGIQPLSHPFAAGYLANIQRFAEETVFPKWFGGLEVVLAQADQADHALERVARRHARRYGVALVQHHRRLRRFAALPDQRQPRVRGQLAVRFLQTKAWHVQNE